MRVPIESKNILMVGFGKIGKIKAYKWMDRGYNICDSAYYYERRDGRHTHRCSIRGCKIYH